MGKPTDDVVNATETKLKKPEKPAKTAEVVGQPEIEKDTNAISSDAKTRLALTTGSIDFITPNFLEETEPKNETEARHKKDIIRDILKLKSLIPEMVSAIEKIKKHTEIFAKDIEDLLERRGTIPADEMFKGTKDIFGKIDKIFPPKEIWRIGDLDKAQEFKQNFQIFFEKEDSSSGHNFKNLYRFLINGSEEFPGYYPLRFELFFNPDYFSQIKDAYYELHARPEKPKGKNDTDTKNMLISSLTAALASLRGQNRNFLNEKYRIGEA